MTCAGATARFVEVGLRSGVAEDRCPAEEVGPLADSQTMSVSFFKGAVVVLTGAGAGIGREMAVQLARAGAALALVDVDAAGLDETMSMIGGAGDAAVGVVADATDASQLAAAATEVAAKLGGVDVLINNAGKLHYGGVLDSGPEDFEAVMRANLGTAVTATKAFLPAVLESPRGRIANLSSAYGLIGLSGAAPYTAAKFAVRGFSESLRSELRRYPHVAVTCVYPGGIKTGIAWAALSAPGVDAQKAAAAFDRHVARTTPSAAAHAILRGVARGKPRVLIGPDAVLADTVARMAGGRYEQVIRVIVRR